MGRVTKPDGKYTSTANIRLKAYEDTGLEPGEILSATEMEKVARALHELNQYKELGDLDRLRELVEADREGRCVVLPVPMHRTLLDTSDPIRPELLKNFRISATWDHCGIVFHSPWNCFLTDIENGHIRLLNEAAEAALKGEQGE